MNSHFHDKDQVSLIFALNGFIWLETKVDLNPEIIEKMAKMRNLIVLLNDNNISLHPKFLFEVYDQLLDVRAKDLLLTENRVKLIENLRI